MSGYPPRDFVLNYNENERTLCYHGPLIYEAKIQKAEIWTDPKEHDGQLGPHYLVHYKGWKGTWDEYVPETRLLKWNENNIALQKELNRAQMARQRAEREALKAGNVDSSLASKAAAGGAKSQAGAAANYINSGVNAGARGTKRSRESIVEEEEYKNRPEIKIVIPDSLKVKLVDDWEAITKNSQLIPLPRTPSVSDILTAYAASCASSSSSSSKGRSAALTTEVCSGLKLYFEKSLGNNLLYRFERNQYGEMKKRYQVLPLGADEGQRKEMADIYGVEHLLRLFVNLPELIAHTSMDSETVTVLREALQDILRYIAEERDNLFNVKYEETSSAYQNIART